MSAQPEYRDCLRHPGTRCAEPRHHVPDVPFGFGLPPGSPPGPSPARDPGELWVTVDHNRRVVVHGKSSDGTSVESLYVYDSHGLPVLFDASRGNVLTNDETRRTLT